MHGLFLKCLQCGFNRDGILRSNLHYSINSQPTERPDQHQPIEVRILYETITPVSISDLSRALDKPAAKLEGPLSEMTNDGLLHRATSRGGFSYQITSAGMRHYETERSKQPKQPVLH